MCGRGLSQRKRQWCRGWVGVRAGGLVWRMTGERGKLPLVVEGGEGQEIRNWPWEPGSRRTVEYPGRAAARYLSFPETHSCFS